jgi:alpha-tubulin suppressor-like RCC1 family protein
LFAFGENSEHQCGVYSKGQVTKPMSVVELRAGLDIKAITCSWRSSILLTNDGRVVAWGLNNFGQLGLPTVLKDAVPFPTDIPLLTQANPRQIQAGRAHTICLINDPPQVITLGFADVGQLGNGNVSEKPFQWPQLLTILDSARVTQIASGLDHNIVLGANGSVYTWGLGGVGQLGQTLDENDISDTPVLLEDLPPMVKVFAGGDHSGSIDEEGYLWMWGSNRMGQLSMPDKGDAIVPVPTKSSWDPSLKIRDVCAGGQHTIVLTDSGELWITGRADDGQLGLGEATTEPVFEFQKIPFFADHNIPIRSVSVGFSHNIAISEDNKVYVWGNNAEGQLGLGDRTNRFTPEQNPFFQDRIIKGVSCGPLHSLVWTEYSIL